MDKNRIDYIELCAFKGFGMQLSNKLPKIKLPTIDELDDKLFSYLYLLSKYTAEFKKSKNNLYMDICDNEKSQIDFVLFLSFFMDCSDLKYIKNTFEFGDKYINYENFSEFMESILIIHHNLDKKPKPKNTSTDKMIAQMEEEYEKRKALAESKIKDLQNEDNGGFLELMSTVSNRHPSINVLNIGELNYYQLLDNYKRLMMIDKYTPCLYGNATEEYVKENNVKHYSSKLIGL